jgi:hypothetical protein
MKPTFKIQRVKGDRTSQCAWPHWFRLKDLKRLRAEIDEAITSKEKRGDISWPNVHELTNRVEEQ